MLYKTALLLILVCLLDVLNCHPHSGNDEANNAQAKEIRGEILLRGFNASDVNQDGNLDREEFKTYGKSPALAAQFDKVDADNDQLITFVELVKAYDRMIVASSTTLSPGNAQSKEISSEVIKEALDKFDANKDGKLSESEYREYYKGSPRAELVPANESFDDLDVNGDGDISLVELLARKN